MDVISDIVVPQTGATDNASTGNSAVAAYMLGEPEYVGIIAIRTDLKIESFKDVKQFADLFAMYMDLGMYVRWLKGIQQLSVITT
jgi:hypothetical protein